MRAKVAFTKINNGTTIKSVLKNKTLEEFEGVNLERESDLEK